MWVTILSANGNNKSIVASELACSGVLLCGIDFKENMVSKAK